MTDIKVSDTEISKDITEISVGDVETVATQPPITVEGYKKEFAIVGDALFATVDTGDVPEWLSTLLNRVVGTYVDDSLLGLQHLDAALQAAISQIDIAKNTYDEQINIQQTIEHTIVSYLSTLNASMGDNTANIVDIRNTYASKGYASSLIANHIDASVNGGAIRARLTEIRNTITTLRQSLSQSIDTLEANITDTESGAIATANAVEKLYTYTGVDTQGRPTGTGLLADLQIVQKQQDGVIETYIGTYDVITYQDTAPADGVPDPDSITLVVAAEPYCNWTPLEGLGVPISTDEEIRRVYKDTSNNKYYVFTSNGWLETTESEYLQDLDALRVLHVGDTYIKYETVSGERKYLGAYKFIRTIEDVTTPYGTDTEGFTWAKITDTDSQNAFMVAVQAKDLADSKRKVFTAQPSGQQDEGDLWISIDSDGTQVVRVFMGQPRSQGFLASEWVIADEQLKRFVDTVYTPESASLQNQIDGKIEYLFVKGTSTYSLGDGAATDLIQTHNSRHNSTYLKNIPSKVEVLNRVKEVVSTTASTNESFHGSVVYFVDTDPAEAYWYSAQRGTDVGTWQVISDTSIYEALATAEKAQTSADGIVVSYYGYESSTNPNTFTSSAEFPALQYWYNSSSSTLNVKEGNGWMPYTGVKVDDTLTTVIVDSVTTDEDGNTVPAYFAKIDHNTYTYNGTSWVSATANGFIAESRKLIELDAFLKGNDGKYGSSTSKLDMQTKAKIGDVYSQVTSKFAYNSEIELSVRNPSTGVDELRTVNSGFGIEASIKPNGDTKNEFWINAETLKFTNADKSGQATPFSIDTSGPTTEVVFNGKITFGGGTQTGDMDDVLAAAEDSARNLHEIQQSQIQSIRNSVNEISRDSVLSATEKQTLIPTVLKIQRTYEDLLGTYNTSGLATTLGIAHPGNPYYAEYVEYANKYHALMNYLYSVSYNNTSTSTSINRTTFRSKFNTYFEAEKKLYAALDYTTNNRLNTTNNNLNTTNNNLNTTNNNLNTTNNTVSALNNKVNTVTGVLGDPQNNRGTVTIDKGVINADALALGKGLVNIHASTTWSPKPWASGVFLNNQSINVIVNGVTRVKIGNLSNRLPTDWSF